MNSGEISGYHGVSWIPPRRNHISSQPFKLCTIPEIELRVAKRLQSSEKSEKTQWFIEMVGYELQTINKEI